MNDSRGNQEGVSQRDQGLFRGGEAHDAGTNHPAGSRKQSQSPQGYLNGFLFYASESGLDLENPVALFRYAKETGSLISRDGLSKIRRSGVELKGGVEHEVFSVPNQNEVGRTIIKVTRPPTDRWAQHRYGLNHDVISYLMRLEKMNRLAPDLDYKILGVTTTLAATKAWPSIVTSMKHIIGEEPNPRALALYLMKLGFKYEGLNVWAHPAGFTLGDVHTGNFIKTPDGRMVPIDVTVEGEC